MVIKEAELLFQAGSLQIPVIKKSDADDDGVFNLDDTHKLNAMLEIALDGPHILKKLDIAVGVCLILGLAKLGLFNDHCMTRG